MSKIKNKGLTEQKLHAALLAHKSGNFELAQTLYKQVLIGDPNNAMALQFLGIISYQYGKYEEAVAFLNKAGSLNPDTAIFKDLSDMYLNRNQPDKAMESLERALQIDSGDYVIYYKIGVIYFQNREFPKTIEYFSLAIKINPNDADMHYSLGMAYHECRKYDEAIKSYRKSLQLNPNNEGTYINLGLAYHVYGLFPEALECYKKFIEINPNNDSVYCKMGNLFVEADDLNRAEFFFNKALSLNPDSADAYFGLGRTFMDDDPDQAISHLSKAIELRPDFSDSYVVIASIFEQNGHPYKAIDFYNKAIEQNYNNIEAHVKLGGVQILTRDFDEGWKNLEWRIKYSKIHQARIPRLSCPLWDGSSLQGKTIYTYSEQGLGDTMHFVRYLPLLKEQGAKIIFKPYENLVKVLDDSDLGAEIINYSFPEESIQADFHIPIMSFPHLFKTNMDNVPLSEGYLKADPEKVREYREKYFDNDLLKVGLVWQCKNVFKRDRLRSIDKINKLFPLVQIPGTRFYSLQKGDGEEQLNSLPEGIEIVNLGCDFSDFADTAAAIENLDVVITIDTSVGHLSGGLGKPTWIMLSKTYDWRWYLDIDYSPWYKNVRLFRQNELEKWDDVISGIGESLKELLKNR